MERYKATGEHKSMAEFTPANMQKLWNRISAQIMSRRRGAIHESSVLKRIFGLGSILNKKPRTQVY
jgi:hypothetical protein